VPGPLTILEIDPAITPDRARFESDLLRTLESVGPSAHVSPSSGVQILKHDTGASAAGAPALVLRATLAGRTVVIKRTPLPFLARLKSLTGNSKGWRHLRNASWLIQNHLPTAPVLMLARHDGAEILVMDALPGRSLLELIASPATTLAEQHALADAAGALVARVVHAGRYNRDHKPSNLIVTHLTPTPAAADLAIIDCVAFIRPGPLTRPIQGPLRMLSSLVIEPLGCGVLPRRSLLMRALRSYLRHSWLLADHPSPARSKITPLAPVSPPDFDRSAPLSPEQRAWELASIRAFWSEVLRTINTHGDPTPSINPLTPSGTPASHSPSTAGLAARTHR
jgi:tRNA A-37 threonylcarbamoyl transferase component Bud32